MSFFFKVIHQIQDRDKMDATRLLLETFIVKFVKKSTYPLWEAYLRNLYFTIWCKIW